MEPEERSIHLHPTDPKRQFWQEGDMAELDLVAFLFRVPHVLTQLLVKFIQLPVRVERLYLNLVWALPTLLISLC